MNGGSRRRSVASAEPPAAGRVPLAEAFALNSFVAPTLLKSAGPTAPPAPFTLAASRGQAAPELEEPRPAFELPPRPGKRPAAPAVGERATTVRRGADPGADLSGADAADTCAVVSESRRAASRRRQSVQPVHDASIAPLSELLSPQAPASRQRRRSVAPFPGAAVDATGHAAVRDQVARLVQLADTLLPCDDAHVAEEEHLPLRERLADAWQGKSYYERLAAMASPAPLSKKPAARNPEAADLSPLSRAASAAAALNDDLQDVPGRPMVANPPPARMLSVLANQPIVRQPSRVVTTAAGAEVLVPASAAVQLPVMPAVLSAPAALAPVIPVAVSATDAVSEASLAEARAEVMRVREQLLQSEVQLQAEMLARCAAEAATDALREDLSSARRKLDTARVRADAVASELAALRDCVSTAASAVRGLLTAAAADAEGRLRALL